MTDVATPSATNIVVSGRYQLVEPLGSGGTGSVYRARDTVLGRDVAIKIFRADAMVAHDLVRQEREIRMLSQLTHPGLINVYDAGRHQFDGSLRRYIVMELVSHDSLEDRMASGPLEPYEVAAIGAQIAGALAYVHSHGVVHRDVKPANILLSDVASGGFRRSAKLGDFGIAHYLDGNRLTSDGTILGTAAYLSPEQVEGKEVDTASDVYSLGLAMLEALTAVQEFPGSVIESAVARVNRDPSIPDTLSDEWRQLLGAMTSRTPSERPTAHEVAMLLHGSPPAELTGGSRRAARSKKDRAHRKASFAELRRRQRRNTVMWILGGVIIASGFVGSFLLGSILL